MKKGTSVILSIIKINFKKRKGKRVLEIKTSINKETERPIIGLGKNLEGWPIGIHMSRLMAFLKPINKNLKCMCSLKG